MASAWGDSWGNSWGNSWGEVSAEPPIPEPVPPPVRGASRPERPRQFPPPIYAKIVTAQQRQSAKAVLEFNLPAAFSSGQARQSATASLDQRLTALLNDIALSFQDSSARTGMRLTTSGKSDQRWPSPIARAEMTYMTRAVTGGLPPPVPDFDEDAPEIDPEFGDIGPFE